MARAETAPALIRRPRSAQPACSVWSALLAVFALVTVVPAGATEPARTATPARFGFDDVTRKAENLAKDSYREAADEVPDWLAEITYDQWRDIRFRPSRALWRGKGLPFQVEFFHPGLYYNRVVAMNTVDAGGVHPIPFSPSDFDYGHNEFASRVPQNLGFAGFRVHAPIKRKDYFDEVIVFLGASYFRAVGKDEVFGLSARGIAIDTALPSGEEFPFFKEFWLVKPLPGAKELTIYGLLDSPSLAGAYRFVLRPGEETAVAVDARIFARRQVTKLGVAPLTSMFFHGEGNGRQVEDFRPEVHDSDGLQIHFAGGEWMWRPLGNPRAVRIGTYRADDVEGFGLLQRDRNFDHYQDLETRRDKRPSAWVAPRGRWGEGQVELVEIPTKSDTNDNIVAYWVPKAAPAPGTMGTWSYTVTWYGEDPALSPSGRVVATRRGRGTADDVYRYVVDFDGPKLRALPADTVLRGVVTVASGQQSADILDQQVVKNPVTGGWRLTFQVRPKQAGPVEMRAFLDKDGTALTETWSDVLNP